MANDIKLNNSGVRFDEAAHRYFLGEKELFGITSMLNRQLGFDYDNIPQHILDEAAARGHAIHSAIEAFHSFGGESAEWFEYVWHFNELTEREELKVLANEYLVTDYQHYASAIDVVFQKGDHIVLGDIKTTSKIHDEKVRWQLSVYAYLFKLLNPDLTIDGICCIWLPTKKSYGQPKLKWYDIIPEEECIRMMACDTNGETYSPATDIAPNSEQAVAAKVAALEEAIIRFTEAEAEAKRNKQMLTQSLKDTFEKYGIKSFKTDKLIITLTEAHTQSRINSTALKKADPEIYEKYLTTSNVSSSLKITIK